MKHMKTLSILLLSILLLCGCLVSALSGRNGAFKGTPKKNSTDDIVFISICRNDDRKQYKQVLDKYGMYVDGIEHIHADDLQAEDQVHKMYNQLNIDGIPYFFIINREGVIVNHGSMMPLVILVLPNVSKNGWNKIINNEAFPFVIKKK